MRDGPSDRVIPGQSGAVCYPERAHGDALKATDPNQRGGSGMLMRAQAAATPETNREGRTMGWLRAQFIVQAPWEFVVLIAVGLFLLLFGLAPRLGGDQLGLVGADEPRYAQVAREMLAAHDQTCQAEHAEMMPRSYHLADLHASEECVLAGTVTPVLYGKPWLEKAGTLLLAGDGVFSRVRGFGLEARGCRRRPARRSWCS